jgi:hypothetical protein
MPDQFIILESNIMFPICYWQTSLSFLITYIITQSLYTARSLTLILVQWHYISYLQSSHEIIREKHKRNRREVQQKYCLYFPVTLDLESLFFSYFEQVMHVIPIFITSHVRN